MKILNDKYYTKPDVAKFCISKINLNKYDKIIEPSAGNGSFSKLIPNVDAYDLFPEDPSIKKQDFLKLKAPICNNLLVIGNPPFGERNKLSKEFIKKSIEIGAETIAFILPDVFNKFVNQKIFSNDWKLVSKFKLDDNFLTENGEYYVPTTFYVWTKGDSKINLREVKEENSKDFSFLKKKDKNADFCFNGNNGKIKEPRDVKNYKAEHYIKSNIDKKTLIQRFKSMNLDFNSSVNGGISWVGKQEIIKAYNSFLKEKNNG